MSFDSSLKIGQSDEASDKRPILINTKGGQRDIAQISYSIAHKISKQEALVIRLYTMDRFRKQLGEAIKDKWPDIEHLIWFNKFRNYEPWSKWIDWYYLNME